MINIKTLVVATIILGSYQFLDTRAADQNRNNNNFNQTALTCNTSNLRFVYIFF